MRQLFSSDRQTWTKVGQGALIIGVAALTRLIPHLPNFSPIMAIAIFGGLTFRSKWAAYGFPLLAMLMSDSLIGFHRLIPLVYGAFMVTTFLSRTVRFSKPWQTVVGHGLFSAVFFFAVTNFGVWAFTDLYPLSSSGLVHCFLAGLPFFRYSLLANLVYLPLMFGALALSISPSKPIPSSPH